MAGYIGKSQGVTLTQVKSDSVETVDIKDNAVTNAKIANSAVTTDKISNGAVTADKIASGAAVPDQTGHAGQFLTTDGTNADWATVNTDLVDDTTPQLGGNLDTNGNDITFGDNDKAIFGAGSDLEIFHDGSHSVVLDNGTGGLKLQGSTFVAMQTPTGENMVLGYANGEVQLRHDNSAKLATTATGINVTGTVVADGVTISDSSPVITITDTDGPYTSKVSSVGSNMELHSVSGNMRFRTGSGAVENMRIAPSGDISFYEDTGTTPKLFWDASAESLGIGTSSPDRKLAIGDYTDNEFLRFQSVNTGYAAIEFGDTQDGDVGEIKYDHTDNYMWFRTSGTERIRIDGSGNVGIGTSSPADELHVSGASDTAARIHTTSTTAEPKVVFVDGSGDYASIEKVDRDVKIKAFNTDVAHFTSSGNVGIGTSSPSASLQVGDATDQYEYITVNGAEGDYSGIKLARGAGDWSSLSNNNYGMLVSDNGFEVSKFTSKGNNVTGKTAYLQLDDAEVNVNKPFGFAQYSSDPTATRAGQVYWNTTDDILRVWNGSYWSNIAEPFDPTTNNAYVRLGFNNNGNNSGTTTQQTTVSPSGSYSYTTSSKIGTHALDFGQNQTGYLDIQTQSTSTTYSMGGWFYITRANAANSRSYIVDFRTSDNGAGYWLFDNLNSMTVKRHNGEETFSYTVPTNQWVHWVITSGPTNFKFYVNGSVYRTGSTYSDNLSTTVTLGTYFNSRGGSGNYFMNGKVDNFFLALTEYNETEVAQIYNSTVDY